MSHLGNKPKTPKGPINPTLTALYAFTITAGLAALNMFRGGEPYVTIALVFLCGGILGVDAAIPRKGGDEK